MTSPAEWVSMAALCLDMAEAAPELDRLSAIGSGLDGYGRGGAGRSGPGSVADPVGALLVALAGGSEDSADTWWLPGDEIGVLLRKLAEQSTKMAGCARRVAGLKRLVDGRGDARVGRQSTLVDCLACETPVSGVGLDRIRSGYCPACHRAWCRYRLGELQEGRPADHEVFRRRRRDSLVKAAKKARAS